MKNAISFFLFLYLFSACKLLACEGFIKAVSKGDSDKVKNYLKNGCDINMEDEFNETPLTAAVLNDHYKIVELLLEKRAHISVKALRRAKSKGFTDIAQLIIGASGNKAKSIELVTGALDGDYEAVKRLLSEGADVNYADNEVGNALMGAISAGNVDIVKLLLSKNVDLNIKDNEGHTALKNALLANQVEIIAILRTAGATE